MGGEKGRLSGISFPLRCVTSRVKEMGGSGYYHTIAAFCWLRYPKRPPASAKTVSTLFPAVSGGEAGGPVVHLTAKTITRQAAEQALGADGNKRPAVQSVTLTAQDKISLFGRAAGMSAGDLPPMPMGIMTGRQ